MSRARSPSQCKRSNTKNNSGFLEGLVPNLLWYLTSVGHLKSVILKVPGWSYWIGHMRYLLIKYLLDHSKCLYYLICGPSFNSKIRFQALQSIWWQRCFGLSKNCLLFGQKSHWLFFPLFYPLSHYPTIDRLCSLGRTVITFSSCLGHFTSIAVTPPQVKFDRW